MNLQLIRTIHYFNSLKSQNEEQIINSVVSLSNASKFKGDKNKNKMEHSTKVQLNTMQNSSGKHEGTLLNAFNY